jgi:FtsH-binding integral membrane protein
MFLELKSNIWRFLWVWFPIFGIAILYFLTQDFLITLNIKDEIVETATTITSIVAGFSGSILISLLTNNQSQLLDDLRKNIKQYKEYIHTFWRSIVLALISSFSGILIMLNLTVLSDRIIHEVLMFIWIFTFLSSFASFFDGFTYTIDKTFEKK